MHQASVCHHMRYGPGGRREDAAFQALDLPSSRTFAGMTVANAWGSRLPCAVDATGDDENEAAAAERHTADAALRSRLAGLSPAIRREIRQLGGRRDHRCNDGAAAYGPREVCRHDVLISVLDALPEHIAVLDRDGTIVVVNRAWRQFAEAGGLSDPSHGVGSNYLDVCAAATGDAAALEAAEGIRAILAGRRETFTLDYACHSPDVHRWYRLLASPAGHGDGAVVAHIDITEQVLADRARSAWKGRFEGVVGNVPGYVYRRLLTPEGETRYAYVSPSAERLFGVPVDAIVADPMVLWNSMEPDDRAKLTEAYSISARDMTNVAVDYRVACDDGGWRWIRTLARPTRLDDGTVIWDGIGLDIDEQKAAENRLNHLAYHDSLTGMANRRLFEETVDRAARLAERSDRSIAVHIIDLDHFKEINDTLGHAAGDVVIKAVAERLRSIVRRTDTLARLGGDEFGILQLNMDGPQDAAVLADKVNASLAEPFLVDGRNVRLSSSIGIDVYPLAATDCPVDDDHSLQLMRRADLALFEAKRTGRGMYHFFSDDIDMKTRARMRLRQALHHAVEQEEFHLLYQPQVDLGTGEVVGVEALIRWRNPELGLVMPDSFIPLAEETGLIVPIGAWVLREACRQAKAWDAAGLPPLTMAVNVSAEQLLRDGFLEALENALAESGLPAERLDLEVTETSLMADTEILLDRLAKLKAFGVNITIDDFGTGYSSFVYLKRLPAMKIKIDRVFVAGADSSETDRALIGAMVAMAGSLGLDLVAEGIETDTQAAVIRELGCRKAQGYLYARPLAPDALSAFVAGT